MDVDYKELMATKTAIVIETAALEGLVKPREMSCQDFMIESDHYYGIGCDLRDLRLLDRAVRSLGGLDETLVLCVAEVSVTYMDPIAADALISWAKMLSKGESGHNPDKKTVANEKQMLLSVSWSNFCQMVQINHSQRQC